MIAAPAFDGEVVAKAQARRASQRETVRRVLARQRASSSSISAALGVVDYHGARLVALSACALWPTGVQIAKTTLATGAVSAPWLGRTEA